MSQNTECCPPQSASNPSKPKVPHPVSKPSGYEPTGRFESIGAYDKVYVVSQSSNELRAERQTGPEDAKHALIVIYDIFGLWDTTIRLGLIRYRAKLDARLPEVIEFAKELKRSHGIDKASILGYCWVHPAMIAAEDGEKLSVPLGFYPSIVTRADLKDPENLKQYEDVYQRLADYLTKVKC
ncbi:hypothetical protein IAR55_004026 [Kwoniella newhampshirensis]|uniref:Dienelactone hydrolase domain-containing protein n=1 Tax=Kwoniella newhampshirensis TaxID=1651941 RepID=A0AAW0YYP0_9TREE